MTALVLPSGNTYLASIFDNLVEPVLAMDPGTRRIIYSNSAAREVFKCDQAQTVTPTALSLFADAEEADRILEGALRYMREHGHAASHCRFRAADDSVFYADLKLTVLLYPRPGDGPVMFILGKKGEAEELPHERAAERLHRSEILSVISSLSRKITHEIASPLNGMHTAAQMLARLVQKGRLDAETLTSSILNLTSEMDRLRSFLSELRQLGLPGDRQQQTAIDLTVLLAEVAGVEREKCEAQGIILKLNKAPAPLIVAVDPSRIKQVFNNLCKNAREAMPQGGTLTLRSYESGADAIVEISDTGVGLDPDLDLYAAFTTSKPEVAGLGLTIALGIVESYHGKITHTSRRDAGTTFRVLLPLSKRARVGGE